MPEVKSDNFPDIWYHLLQKQAETHQLCYDGVLFHQTEQNKRPDKQ